MEAYLTTWSSRGYSDGIPDEVPAGIMDIAPSWKAVAWALLNNDMSLSRLGMPAVCSEWYSVLKAIELRKEAERQRLFRFVD